MPYPYDVDPRAIAALQREREIDAVLEKRELRQRIDRLERALMARERQSRMTQDSTAGSGQPKSLPAEEEEAPAKTPGGGISRARALSRLATGVSLPAYFAIQAYVDDPGEREKYLDTLSVASGLAHAPAAAGDLMSIAQGAPLDGSSSEAISRVLPLLELASRKLS